MRSADSLAAKLLGLALAGAAGSLARYALAGWVHRLTGESAFPWGTLAVNALGCFAFGLIWSLAEARLNVSPHTRLIVLVGFMGAFTTFSTFAFETSQLLADRQWLLALVNVAAQNVVGIALAVAGFAIGATLAGTAAQPQ